MPLLSQLVLAFFGYAKFIGVDKVLKTTRRKCLCRALLWICIIKTHFPL